MTEVVEKLDVEGMVYKTLLESTKAIPWRIQWDSLSFSYIGPQIEELLGWAPDSWMSVQDWADRIHPEDREWAVNFCVAQSKAGVDHEADYRALCKDGSYVWIRDVVHVVRKDDGSVDALVGFMFDISERKRTEQRLIELQRELETLSFKDGLTGIANRRRFDAVFGEEWDNARRSGRPLSMLMLDIDYFKQYNDHYGHVQGDYCLKVVAKALEQAVRGPRDFLARFGGEEFVLILPDTDAGIAQQVAERCHELIRTEWIPHERSMTGMALTLSVGAGTVVPMATDERQAFLELVDRRLYSAKVRGRNTTVSGEH
ncbi:GGDEF domain-containing protein [Dyella japonica]|uniref:diguanylate cyclase n=1 Tax=Dyella japonica A8 TaxID=1217721 RepID=A0A075K1F0_9GAMM|nr:sensor domain-containing diguanylate cyclase [Dyella japonica]AIF47620.1 diguanylate cyclase [Dyella japonica A8]